MKEPDCLPVYWLAAAKFKHFGLELTAQTWYPLWNTHLEGVAAATTAGTLSANLLARQLHS